MGGLIRWLRHHRSRRVSSSSSSHLPSNTTSSSSTSDLRAHSLPQHQGDHHGEVVVEWEDAAEGPDSDPEEYIVVVLGDDEQGVVAARAPVRTKPPRVMDPGKKVRSCLVSSSPFLPPSNSAVSVWILADFFL